MFVENTFTVIDKQTGRKYDCFEQWINLNYDGKMIHRYIVGINGSSYWTLCCTYYSDEALEKDYYIDFDSYAKYVGADEAWFIEERSKRNEE